MGENGERDVTGGGGRLEETNYCCNSQLATALTRDAHSIDGVQVCMTGGNGDLSELCKRRETGIEQPVDPGSYLTNRHLV